jgi:sigma-B regulation protein RsbU (phosphoserine phosphatase)
MGAGPERSLDEERLTLALEAASMGTWTWSMAAGRTIWDERLEELHGLAPGGFGGTFEDWVESLHPDDRATCIARVEDALADPGPYVLLHRTIWPSGAVHWIECRGRVTVDDDGAPTGTIGVAHDVTTRMERDAAVERELRRTYDAVEQLQHTLLPSRLPSVAGVEVAARYEPARATVVGGDWYAVVPLPDGCVGLGIGDVAGHGLVAVEAMASARFSLRALALAEPSASRVLDRLDEAFSLFESDTLMTALYGVLDPTGPTWAFTSAGHCPPVRRAPDGVVSVVQTRAQPPIGMCSRYRHDTVSLSHGDVLVLYTDGLVERRDEPITAGIERLCAALETGPDAPDALVEHLAGTLVDARSNDDDVALMVVRIA